MKIINGIRDNGLTRAEFDRIKTMMDGQNLLGIQTNEDYAQFYSVPALHGFGLDFQHEAQQTVRDIAYGDFQKFLAHFMAGPWNIVTAGPN